MDHGLSLPPLFLAADTDPFHSALVFYLRIPRLKQRLHPLLLILFSPSRRRGSVRFQRLTRHRLQSLTRHRLYTLSWHKLHTLSRHELAVGMRKEPELKPQQTEVLHLLNAVKRPADETLVEHGHSPGVADQHEGLLQQAVEARDMH